MEKKQKKKGFFSMLDTEDICKFCKGENEKSFYCSIQYFAKKGKPLLNTFQNFKHPIVLVATSECFDLKKDVYI